MLTSDHVFVTRQNIRSYKQKWKETFKNKETGATFYKESRPEVVNLLRQVCERYGPIERKYMSKISEQANWIANVVPDGVARATPKDKSLTSSTSVLKVHRKSLNSGNGSLRLS
jgi:hypothetical protein